jgi:hypothetical protein
MKISVKFSTSGCLYIPEVLFALVSWVVLRFGIQE